MRTAGSLPSLVLVAVLCGGFPRVAAAQQAPYSIPPRVLAATPEYDMTIRILPEAHRMELSGTLRLPPQDKPTEQLDLYLNETMKAFHVEILQPAESAGSYAPTRVASEDRGIHWSIRPSRPLSPHQPVLLRFSCQGGEGISYTFYLGPEGSFGGQGAVWYPRSGRGRGRLRFLVPPGYIVLSTGARTHTAESSGEFAFDNTVPTNFAFAVGRYNVLTTRGAVPVHIYLLHPHPAAGAYLAGISRAMLALTREFGPYPYPEFSIAEVPSDQANQASFSGASMNGFMLASSASLDAPFNLAFYAHEISHQWWANLVTHTGPLGAYMLDEAMAQFGSLRAVEAIEGGKAAERYRRTGYPGYGASNSGHGYLLSSEAIDHDLADLPDDSWAHGLADSKGFLVWDLLSRTIGRERFRAALRGVTRQYAFQSIRWGEFLDLVQKASPTDLQWFFSQWFGRRGAPEWTVQWDQLRNMIRGVVVQSEPFYRQRVEVELTGANYGQQRMYSLELTGLRTDFAWPIGFPVHSLEIDPHYYVLHWSPELHAAARARAPALRAFQLSDSGKYDEAEAELRGALASLPQPDSQGALFWTEYALGYLSIARKDWVGAQRHLDAALAAPTRDADVLPWFYWRYAQVAKSLHDHERLRWAVEASSSADAALGGGGEAPHLARELLDK